MQHALIQIFIKPINSFNIKKEAIQFLFYYNLMLDSGYRIMAIIRGFQPFDESSILSTRSI